MTFAPPTHALGQRSFLTGGLFMEINISLVPYEKKHILRNLLELYFYDMSEFDDEDDRLELNDCGLYGYQYLDHYWTEEGRYPYILTIYGKLAGLALIRMIEANPQIFSIAEFFVHKKYRQMGVGMILANKMLELHRGNWIINTPIKNVAAQHFWRKVVKNASGNRHKEYFVENDRRLEWSFYQ